MVFFLTGLVLQIQAYQLLILAPVLGDFNLNMFMEFFRLHLFI